MLQTEEKKRYFDDYWESQPIEIADPRATERAERIGAMLERKGGKVLDVGCGRGIVLEYFARKGYDVTGIDISPETISRIQKMGYKAYLGDLEADEIGEKYDIVLCLEVLQQLFDPSTLLSKMKSVFSPGGEIFVSVPNEFHIVSRLKILFGFSHLGKFNHSHIRLFTPIRGRELLKNAGLEIIREIHIPIIPPRWKFLSRLFYPLAEVFPSLLAISSIYRARAR